MASDMLSQEEIDALLKQGDSEEDGEATESSLENYLTEIDQDALGEIGNITFGSASTALSTLLSQKVDITTPTLTIVKKEGLKDEFPQPHVAVHVNYTEGFEGTNLLVIKVEDAKIIADLMLGGDGKTPEDVLNDMHVSAVQEAMNQMMGSAATSMSTLFNKRIDISPPGIDVFDPQTDEVEEKLEANEDVLVKVSFRIKVGQLIDSNIMQLIPVTFAKHMVQLLMNPEAGQPESKSAEEENQGYTTQDTSADVPVSNEQTSQQQQPVQQQASQQSQQQPMFQQPEQNQSQNQNQNSQIASKRSANVQPVQFSNFDEQPAGNTDIRNLNLLLDIPLQVTVELGRTKRLIKEILELSPGSILELDKLAGEPVDILINNKHVAKGEVVVIEENFGVRVTDILSQWDRLQKLQ